MRAFLQALRYNIVAQPIEFLTLVVTALGLAIAIGGAVFVYLQIVAVNQALDSQAYATITQGLNDLDKIFVDNPKARPQFFNNAPAPDNEEDRQRVEAIAEIYLNFIDNFYGQTSHLDPSHYQFDAWERFFRDSFKRSKVLCDHFEQEKKEYGDEINAIAKKSCASK